MYAIDALPFMELFCKSQMALKSGHVGRFPEVLGIVLTVHYAAGVVWGSTPKAQSQLGLYVGMTSPPPLAAELRGEWKTKGCKKTPLGVK